MSPDKPLPITKAMVWKAYQQVKRNGNAAGVDGQSLDDFAKDLENNLYRLWNRMASGSYFPPPVRRVEIPKSNGGVRPLGIPTVADRIAQMVVKQMLEPQLEPIFDQDSYGYRPGKSAHQAVESCRKRCWKYDWVVDLDIKGFFDSIDHDLLMRAIQFHTSERWVVLYLRRWLEAPVELPDGSLQPRTSGTPQGGVISPLLANLFLHYTFDKWMRRSFPRVPFERYADDVICHCHCRAEAERLMDALQERFTSCGLQLHPEKTKVVYCKDSSRRGQFDQIQFTFLGFCFRPRMARNRYGEIFTSFLPAVSPQALKRMRERIRKMHLRRRMFLPLEEIARLLNPILRGWIQYYGRFYPTELRAKLFGYLNEHLSAWLRQKHSRLLRHDRRSRQVLARIAQERRDLFAHWRGVGVAAG
ncbi:group II intron reverse transcriptase/maturase [Synechococcus sp. CBW1108]|jgi:RNA-directed DNA polymerase|uniref:group II intron reverse transcriptase/maturase n=1 Tax=Synechococcus sp. CBW1108 TaxID=1353147 RepID=UPI0018CFCEBB|nr:group II intron reverse transcriptase/maturase [Synechococcus sp. CBW1108]QPN71491.1 group II intron reverse transcriptase/maturase [Synechococcus sp. CBW1108]QPN71507.1 group II intron reverse transcriptase/maturase [Synechococcus sp. CBW1108]QPN71508.1 group II intron reverse transcriptase/maturase [Synechococcus sp. CBW1108]